MDSFHGKIDLQPPTSPGAPPGTGEVTAKFVHYPDCQQLILWLPSYGPAYGELRLTHRDTGSVLQRAPVADRLSGSVQLLFDTVGFAPGSYSIEVDHPDGWRHVVQFTKRAVNEAPVAAKEATSAPSPAASPTVAPVEARRVYRDGFGNVIPDVDLEMRARAQKDLIAKFTRHLEYEGTYRSGYVTYVEGDLRIRFLHEMGGAPCKFYIEVPTAAQWEAHTGSPAARRDEIVAWVAAAVQREKASSWRYEISDDQIAFY